MKTKHLLTLILFSFLALNTGCAKKNLTDSSNNGFAVASDPLEDSAETGIQSLGGILDEQSNSSYANFTPASGAFSKIALLRSLIDPAYAANCSRAVIASCDTGQGIQSALYSGCAVGGSSSFTINGSVSLSYSNNLCQLSNNGDIVTRQYDYTISGPRGGQMRQTSGTRANYLGQSYGGGGRLTKIGATQWSLAVSGKHVIATYGGRTLFDVTVHTTSEISVSNGLTRSNRLLNGGQIVVDHNIAGFTAVFSPSNLQYSSFCSCSPVSGSMTISYSGSLSGSALISFNACNDITFTKDGVTRNISLSYCE